MARNNLMLTTMMFLTSILFLPGLIACSPSNSSTTPSPSGGNAVVQSDSTVIGQIKNIRKETTSYPWEVDVLIQSSESVDDLPNPTEGKVGQVITARTDENLGSFKVGQAVTSRVKYIGDVPRPGISLYMYDIRIYVTLREEFAIAIGQGASIAGEDFQVRFIEVKGDSRCPKGATCIWAGEASCTIEITDSGSAYRKVLTQPGLSGPSRADLTEYEITFDLQPYPEAGKEIEREKYRLLLTFNR